MQTILSEMENNYVKGVLIKKGKHTLTDKEFDTVHSSPVFKNYVKFGYIKILGASETRPKEKAETGVTPDFASMSYEELKAYVKEHNIPTASNKKADLLAALNV